MFAYIKGIVTHKEPSYIVIETAGIGYLLRTSLQTYSDLELGKEFQLFTHLQIKEDAHTLFGFLEQIEKQLFMKLIGVSGVGATTALAMLSTLSVSEIKDAIVHENAKLIQKVKGVGTKTAQMIILQLREKLLKEQNVSGSGIAFTPDQIVSEQAKEEAISALITLGFTQQMAEKNIDFVIKRFGGELSVEDLIKNALKNA
ncbi:MAG: Holliday junction branch migration protein RuvA [Bacteroidetes bacterium]|nr:MAG: Holliday junction branch migration protein RuvA [Bacteroidota bacterium]